MTLALALTRYPILALTLALALTLILLLAPGLRCSPLWSVVQSARASKLS